MLCCGPSAHTRALTKCLQKYNTHENMREIWGTKLPTTLCQQKDVRGDADKSLFDKEGNKLQRPNSGFVQHTPHEAQYISYPVPLTFASHSKKKSESCPSNQVSAAAVTSALDEKWRPFDCFFFSVHGTGGIYICFTYLGLQVYYCCCQCNKCV